MKSIMLKILCLMMAATILLTGCGQKPSTGTTGTSDTTASTTEGTTSGTTEEQPGGLPVVNPEKYNDAQISEEELYDKMMGGWLGQMIGVAWTASTEFAATGNILPEVRFHDWTPGMINNAYQQDDVYVEIPFLDAMKENGAFCSPAYMAEKFEDTIFGLWHANAAARNNLRAGYSWYDAGHYLINGHADDIDWQIECDFLGAMYPGLVNEAAMRAYEIGHMMCYGDGVYGGVFVTAMHSAAYTAKSVQEIVDAGISVIPTGTKFRTLMEAVTKAHREGKTWEEAWQIVENNCGKSDKCVDCCEGAANAVMNIDAKLNAAYILIGLLWGEGDFAKTVEISCRCGQDSDCNPSSAASILGNFYGASGLDEIYKQNVNYDTTLFSETRYTLNQVVEINMNLTKEVMTAYGATEKDGVWTFKTNKSLETVPFEQWADDFGADVIFKMLPNGMVQVVAGSTGKEALKSMEIDMGDGFTMYSGGTYSYKKTGTYTVKYTFVGVNGTVIKGEKKVKIEPILTGKGISSAGDNALIFDGVIPYLTTPNAVKMQYELKPAAAGEDVWIGVQFDKAFAVNGLKFAEGKQNKKGGWFTETPKVEVLVGGAWTPVEATMSYAYPGNSIGEQGDAFQLYQFKFDEIVCEGIRLVGKAGGTDPYISVGELTPYYNASSVSEEYDNASAPIAICSMMLPTGSGSRDLTIIFDGVIDTLSYDTYNIKVVNDVDFFGYQFREARKVSTLTFTEGYNYSDGGWFKNGDVNIEVLINGSWQKVAATASPAYPNGNQQSNFGANFETYTFTLAESVLCDGIRISGAAGGNGHFISINELTVG
ncbi:MAG: ADP-ribosylglycohydrolase family protein [Clostridia bacterium]|nr:ADP-ribosylglycohydrolase family protein [Clostridia bacterium]